MELPMMTPRRIMMVARLRKMCRSWVLVAPMAFMMPMKGVRSRIMMSSPLVMVTMATRVMSMSMAMTLVSRRLSHENICGCSSLTVGLA